MRTTLASMRVGPSPRRARSWAPAAAQQPSTSPPSTVTPRHAVALPAGRDAQAGDLLASGTLMA